MKECMRSRSVTANRILAFVLTLCMVITMTPFIPGSDGKTYAAGNWALTYDSAYPSANLFVEIFDVTDERAEKVETWTVSENAHSIIADRSAQSLFGDGHTYKAVVQYADPDSSVRAVYRAYTIAIMEENGTDFDEEWNNLPDSSEDPEEETKATYGNDKDAYIDALIGIDAMTTASMRTQLDLAKQTAEYMPLPEGFVMGDYSPKAKIRVVELAGGEPTLNITADFFDNCQPVNYTLPAGNFTEPTTTDYGGGAVVTTEPTYKDGGICLYLEDGGKTIPAAINLEAFVKAQALQAATGGGEGDEGEESQTAALDKDVDKIIYELFGEEMIINQSLDATLYPGYKYYVEPGTYTMTYSDERLSPSIADWESATVGASGGTWNFASGRSYATVAANLTPVTKSESLSSVMLTLYPEGVPFAVGTNMVKIEGNYIDGQTIRIDTAKVRSAAYKKAQFIVLEMDMEIPEDLSYEDPDFSTKYLDSPLTIYNYLLEDPAPGTISGSKTYDLGKVTETNWNTSLSFVSKDTNSAKASYTPGEAVKGIFKMDNGNGLDLILLAGARSKATILGAGSATGMFDILSYLTTRATYPDGTVLTGENGIRQTKFPFNAPDTNRLVTAEASVSIIPHPDLNEGSTPIFTFNKTAAATITVTEAEDITPPAVPANLTAAITQDNANVDFTWSAVADADAAGYRLYRTDSNGAKIGEYLAQTTTAAANIAINSTSWGQGPWYFAVSAYDTSGNESACSGTVTVQDPNSAFTGTEAVAATAGTLADGVFTLTDSNEGALSATFTAAASVTAENMPESMTAVLNYKDLSGAAAATQPVTLTKTDKTYSGTIAITQQMATLNSVAFQKDGATISSKSLNADVKANISFTLPAAGDYALAGDFEKLSLTQGGGAAAQVTEIQRSEGAFAGQYLRKNYNSTAVSFFIGEEAFAVSGELGTLLSQSAADDFAVSATMLPAKICLSEQYMPANSRIDFFVDYLSATGEVLATAAFPNLSGAKTVYAAEPAAAAGAAKIKVRMMPKSTAFEITGTGEIFSNSGVVYSKGGKYTASGTLQAKGLQHFIYLDVLCGNNADQPAKTNLSVKFEDSHGDTYYSTWYYLTKQVDLEGIPQGSGYTVTYEPDARTADSFDQVPASNITVAAGNPVATTPAGTIRLYDRAEITASLYFKLSEDNPADLEMELDNANVQDYIFPEDLKVYYRSKSGQWIELPGSLNDNIANQLNSPVSYRIASFKSEPVLLKDIDVDAGLKVDMGETATLYTQQAMGSYLQPVEYRKALIQSASREALTTNASMTVTKTYASEGKYGASYFQAPVAQNINYTGTIGDIKLSNGPSVHVTATRNVESGVANFLFRNHSTGEATKIYCEPFSQSLSGGEQNFYFSDLPAGIYDVLFYLPEDGRNAQLEERFLEDPSAFDSRPDVSAASKLNVNISEANWVVEFNTPPEALKEGVTGIQAVTITPVMPAVMPGDMQTFLMRFTYVPGAGNTTLSFAEVNSVMTIRNPGVSVKLKDGAGAAVECVPDASGRVTLPENRGTLTGTIAISGTIENAGGQATLKASDGESSWFGSCQVTDFSQNLPSSSKTKTISVSGRGPSGNITAEIVSKTNSSQRSTQNITVSSYGYWKTDLVLPSVLAEGTEEYIVTFKNAGGTVLGTQAVRYTASNEILPTIIRYKYYYSNVGIAGSPANRQQMIITGTKTDNYSLLKNAVATFGSGFGDDDPITVEIEFDDTDASRDANGYTDAQKVANPTLLVDGPNYWKTGSYLFDFTPVDQKTYSAECAVVSGDGTVSTRTGTVPYSTKYTVSYLDKYYGIMNIDYDILNPAGTTVPGISTTTARDLIDPAKLGDFETEWDSLVSDMKAAEGHTLINTETISGTLEGTTMGAATGEGLGVDGLSAADRKKLAETDIVSGEYVNGAKQPVDMDYEYTHSTSICGVNDIEAFVDGLEEEADSDWIYYDGSNSDSALAFMRYKVSYGMKASEDQPDSFYDTSLAASERKINFDIITTIDYEYLYNLSEFETGAGGDQSGLFSASGMELMAGGNGGNGGTTGGKGGTTIAGAAAKGTVKGLYESGKIINKGLEMANTSFEIADMMGLQPASLTERPEIKGEALFAATGNQTVGKIGGVALKGASVVGKALSIKDTIMTDSYAAEKAKVAAIKNDLRQIRASSLKRCNCIMDPNAKGAVAEIEKLYFEGNYKIDDMLEGLEMQENVNDGIDIAQEVVPSKVNLYGIIAGFVIDAGQMMGNDVIDSNRWHDVNEVFIKYYNGISRASFACDPKECQPKPEEPSTPVFVDPLARKKSVYIGPRIETKHLIDPSGVVYEGTLANPVSGAECTIQYNDGSGNWVDWTESTGYNDQQTVITTNASGYYQWDVPTGKWRVEYFKEGYNNSKPIHSGEMDVPPVWLDVDQNMLATNNAASAAVSSQGGTVIVTFDKPVQWSVIDNATAKVAIDGRETAGTWSVIKGGPGQIFENGITFKADGTTESTFVEGQLVTQIMFTPAETPKTGSNFAVTLAGESIKSYGNSPLTGATVLTGTIAGGTAPHSSGGGGAAAVIPVTGAEETVKASPDGGSYTALNKAVRLKVEKGSFTATTEIVLSKGDGTGEAYSPAYGMSAKVQPSDTMELTFKLNDAAKTVAQPLKLGMWVREDGKTDWTFAGGSYDTANNTLTILSRVNGTYEARYTSYSFKDLTEKHWAWTFMDTLASRQILMGDNLGNANPDAPVTRAELATLMVRVLQANSLLGRTPAVTSTFSDVKEADWFYYNMNLAAKRGIISGYGDGTAKPDNNVTREELAAVLARAITEEDAVLAAGKPDFNDGADIAAWAENYVAILQIMKFLGGDDKGNFNPKDSATRAEVAKLMYKTMEMYGLLNYDSKAPELPCLTCPYSR